MVLFNDQDFLFSEGFLERGESWQLEFKKNEGLAGLALMTGYMQYSLDIPNDSRFSTKEGDVPIFSMVCVPIMMQNRKDPFGVVSFHNESPDRKFSQSDLELIEACSDTLGLALQLAGSSQQGNRIFIVHGRDLEAVNALRVILMARGVDSVLLRDKVRVGRVILEALEDSISDCRAGFVLLTPDDEGRLRPELSENPDEPYQNRARQNVIFEGGMLVERYRSDRRVCFLKRKGPLDVPSDIEGLMLEEFDVKDPNITRIEKILSEWRIPWTQPK